MRFRPTRASSTPRSATPTSSSTGAGTSGPAERLGGAGPAPAVRVLGRRDRVEGLWQLAGLTADPAAFGALSRRQLAILTRLASPDFLARGDPPGRGSCGTASTTSARARRGRERHVGRLLLRRGARSRARVGAGHTAHDRRQRPTRSRPTSPSSAAAWAVERPPTRSATAARRSSSSSAAATCRGSPRTGARGRSSSPSAIARPIRISTGTANHSVPRSTTSSGAAPRSTARPCRDSGAKTSRSSRVRTAFRRPGRWL